MSQPGISEKVGTVRCADGAGGMAYRALRDLVCSSCGVIIKTSELFTRWSLASASPIPAANQLEALRLVARCRNCIPFFSEQDAQAKTELPDDKAELSDDQLGHKVEEKKAANKSSLIKHLMTHANDSMDCTTSDMLTGKSAEEDQADAFKVTGSVSEKPTAAEAVYQRLAPALNGNRRYMARGSSPWHGKRRR